MSDEIFKARPSYYDNDVQPIDIIESYNLNFNLGNIIKYVLRAGKKESRIKDLKKAQWYLNREINKGAGVKKFFSVVNPDSVKLIGIDGAFVGSPDLFKSADGQINPDQFTGTPYEQLIEYAGRICYDSVGKNYARPTNVYLQHIIESNHTSVLGHGVLHFLVSKNFVSRFAVNFADKPGWYAPPDWPLLTNDFDAATLTISLRFVVENSVSLQKGWAGIYYSFVSKYPAIFGSNDQAYLDNTDRGGDYSWVSVEITCSRSCSHEWIRHSFQSAISQRSTRYVNEYEYQFIAHPSFPLEIWEKYAPDIQSLNRIIKDLYTQLKFELEDEFKNDGLETRQAQKLAKGVVARLLPHGLQTKFVYTASLREWNNIFKQRITPEADAEIREIATLCKNVIQKEFK